MLTPEYLENCTDALLALYDALSESIAADIARRIVKTGIITESAQFQMEKLQGAGMVYQDALKRISEISGYTQAELARMFEEAGITNLNYEDDIYSQAGYKPIPLKQSPEMRKMLQAGLDKTDGVMYNLTLTTANMAQAAYINACDAAYLKVASGAFSYQEAVRQAIKDSAAAGTEVLYPSGHKDKLDVAIRRSVLTGVNQTMSKVSLEYGSQIGCDYVETTAHSGARPDHESWQGQVFCVSGKDRRYRPFSDTGYGSGSGLCGWNCRHSFHAFVPGASTPSYTKEMLDDYKAANYEYDGKKLTDYECSQMQRQGERELRATKRKLTACNAAAEAADDPAIKAGLRAEFEKESVRLKQQEKQLKDFCKQTQRRYDSARTQVHAVRDNRGKIVNFNKSVSQKAVDANKEVLHRKYQPYLGTKTKADTFASLNKIEYNKNNWLLDGFIKAVDKGDISPLTGFEQYIKTAKEVEKDLIGLVAANGTKINGMVTHFVDRVIGQQAADSLPVAGMRMGVTVSDLKEAILHGTVEPIKISGGKPSQRVISDKCVVTINPDTGMLIQANPKTGR